jgi:hypothetical protein
MHLTAAQVNAVADELASTKKPTHQFFAEKTTTLSAAWSAPADPVHH